MKRILSFFILLVFITGSLHLSMASHFCGGKLVDFAFAPGKPDVSCGMEKGNSPCMQGKSFEKNCCKNKFQTLHLTDNFFSSSKNNKPLYSKIKHSAASIFEKTFSIFSSENKLSASHSPPYFTFERLSFLQVFRI